LFFFLDDPAAIPAGFLNWTAKVGGNGLNFQGKGEVFWRACL